MVNLLGLYRPLLVVGHGNDGMTAVTSKPYWPTDEFEALLPSDYRLDSEETPGRDLVKPYRGEYNRRKETP